MLSFFLLKFLVNYIDKVSAPIAKRFLNTSVPGIGFSVTVLIVLGIGVLGTNIIGKKFVSSGERLWADVLGRPASYGCIILDLNSAAELYNWAEDGVIVEIKR